MFVFRRIWDLGFCDVMILLWRCYRLWSVWIDSSVNRLKERGAVIRGTFWDWEKGVCWREVWLDI